MSFLSKKFKIQKNRGMSYVELIVVLSIFSILSGVVIFNYGAFQSKIDTKSLASDIALKVVQAQKDSSSGKLPPSGYSVTSAWKPSYGVYFNLAPIGGDDKSFTYFVDLEDDLTAIPTVQNGLFDGNTRDCTGECLEKIAITKGEKISRLDIFYQGSEKVHSVDDLTLTFSRIKSGTIINSTPPPGDIVSYAQITIVSPNGAIAKIKVYPSGRIQVN